EFAANEAEVPQLETLFASLGFSPAGRHRSKDVVRWKQNAINFVINSEPESFARAYDATHGASVCALGLSVENVGGAVERAQGLRISRFTPRAEPSELMIPALLGVGGSLTYLMEARTEGDIWEREFESAQGSGHSVGAGLLRVDHVAQTMHYEEMLSWLLYYSSLFELSKTPA